MSPLRRSTRWPEARGVTVQNVCARGSQKILDQKRACMVGGDMGKFMQYQTAQSIEVC
jgi:hypothetical protein